MSDSTNRSPFNGFVKMSPGELGSNEYFDVAVIKDGIMNNLEALYNRSFQTRVNIFHRQPIQITKTIVDTDSLLGTIYKVCEGEFILTAASPVGSLFSAVPTQSPLYVECAFSSDTPGQIVQLYLSLGTSIIAPSAPVLPLRSDSNVFETTSSSVAWRQLKNSDVTSSMNYLSCLNRANYIDGTSSNNINVMNSSNATVETVQQPYNKWALYMCIPPDSTANGIDFQGFIVKEVPHVR